MSKSKELGLGVGALFGKKDETKITENGTPLKLDINLIEANEYQPRSVFAQEELQELANSIKEQGLIQPIIVIKKDDKYQLIAGERRLRAHKILGLTTIEAIVRQANQESQSLMALIENIQREDLNPVELARAYTQAMKDFKLTQEKLGDKIGVKRAVIANYCRILNLPEEVLSKVEENILTFGHAKVLAAIKDAQMVIDLANKIIKEGLSVSRLSKLLADPEEVKKLGTPSEKETMPPEILKFQDDINMMLGLNCKIKPKKAGAGFINIPYENKEQLDEIIKKLLKEFKK